MCHPKTPGGCAADTVVRFAGVGIVQESTVRAIESVWVCQWAGDTTGEERRNKSRGGNGSGKGVYCCCLSRMRWLS
jgi:hypothetical protein